MTIRQYIDNAPATTLPAGINNTQTSFSVASLVGFPATTPWPATLDLGTASAEQVIVTTVVGTTITVTRNSNGQGAFSHPAQSTFQHTANALEFQEANAHINATTNVHGVTGALVDTGTVQTLSNKTLSGATAAFSAVAATPGVSITSDADTTVVWQAKNHLGTITSKVDGAGNWTATTATYSGAVAAASLALTGAITAVTTITASGNITGGTITSVGLLSGSSVAFSSGGSFGNDVTVTGQVTAGGIQTTSGTSVGTNSIVATGGTTISVSASGGTNFNGGVGAPSLTTTTLHGNSAALAIDATAGTTANGPVTATQFDATSVNATTLASTNQGHQVGPTAGVNVAGDNTGLQARNNGAASALNLNALGGNVTIGNASSAVAVPGKITSAPTFQVGVVTIAPSSASSFTVAVTFPTAFAAAPTSVFTNLPNSTGSTAGWITRAYNITATGFTFYAAQVAGTAGTWSQGCGWLAVA